MLKLEGHCSDLHQANQTDMGPHMLQSMAACFAMMHMAVHKMGLHQRRSAESCLLMK